MISWHFLFHIHGFIIDRFTPMPRTLFMKDGFCSEKGDAAHVQYRGPIVFIYTLIWLGTYMTLSKQTSRRGHGFASLFPSMDKKSFPLGSKCEAFGPYDSLRISFSTPKFFCFMLFS